MYNVITSIIIDLFKNEYSEDELKDNAANIINRMTFRNETRPDPRNLNNDLANELMDISSRQLIKEAVSMVLILDNYIGDFNGIRNLDCINEAKKLGGNLTDLIIDKLNPSKSKPEEIYTLCLKMSMTLNSIAKGGFNMD